MPPITKSIRPSCSIGLFYVQSVRAITQLDLSNREIRVRSVDFRSLGRNCFTVDGDERRIRAGTFTQRHRRRPSLEAPAKGGVVSEIRIDLLPRQKRIFAWGQTADAKPAVLAHRHGSDYVLCAIPDLQHRAGRGAALRSLHGS